MTRTLPLLAVLLLFPAISVAEFPKPTAVLDLWPDGPPDNNGLSGPEKGTRCVGNISKPTLLVYLPVMMAFWHAPPLVFWHGVSPAKSLFFSLVACWSNKGALLLFLVGWVVVFMLTGLFLGLLGSIVGGSEVMQIVVYPIVLFMASMFHTSLWFTFSDSFRFDEEPEAG